MSEWKTYKLEEIASVQTGPFGSQLHQSDYVELGTPIITVEHLGENRILHNNLPKVSDKDKQRLNKYWLKEGDIVFSRVGSVDRRAYVKNDEDGWLFSGRCLRVRPTKHVIGKYLSYFFGLEEFKKKIRGVAVGATMPSLNTSIMNEIEVTLPDEITQAQIASILSSLDDKIELNLQMNRTLEAMAQAIFKEWFDSSDMVSLSEYVELNPKLSVKKETLIKYVEMANLPELGSSIKSFIERPFTSGSKFQNLDVLLARITPCLENGKTALVDFLSDDEVAFGSTEFIIMRAKKTISPYYVYILSRQHNFREFAIKSMVGTSGRQRVQTDLLNSFELPKIDLTKMNDFHTIVSSAFKKIKANSEESKLLSQIRDTLLPKLITGKIEIKA
ncbi:restriction endonuclease [Terrimonas sp.]|uniref:restriction endonuclease subunit S n=1 Tax=Terrimonas sp. TaxID=1914338 RepID=UPI000D51C939|nr:restriction endonuclease subunit S [Terrimonas sp.]PVD51081.1 restriction endonuclease [Terrimonas sp.]